MGHWHKIILALALGVALSGCASGGDDAYDATPRVASIAPPGLPAERGTNHVEERPGQALLQCVPYAREHSAIKITGDAYTWWDQAAGRYERGANPAQGTVMVLFHYAGPSRGHVAVVRRVVSAREIRIDHANWLDDGAIYVNDPVVDVSAANDWSQIRVWNIKTGGWGSRVYPVQGFIGPGSGSVPGEDRSAPPPDDAVVAADDEDATDAPSPPQRPVASAAARVQPARSVRSRAANPVVPVSMTPADRNPAPNSGFALTESDLALQPNN